MNSSQGGEESAARGGLGLAAACLIPFLLLATLNSAGYRYGASDQAFYAPAMLAAMDPGLYPRDASLIQAQAQLTFADNLIGPVARLSGLPALLAALQIITLGLLAFAAVQIAGVLYRTRWAAVALLAALTLRHAVIKSGTNTLEGYFHPRQLAFALGAAGIASFLRGRYLFAFALVAGAAALHPTTGCWLGIWIGVATFVAEPRLRAPLMGVAVAGVIAAAWALTAGPLAGRLLRMDDVWLQTLSSKDYLFPLTWPVTAWLVNLAYAPVIWWIYSRRRAAGLAAPREGALVAGCLSLLIVFAVAVPLNAIRFALAIQLQPARVFWMLDFLAIVYIVWAAAEGPVPKLARARAVAICFAALATIRGVYIMTVEFPDRPVAQVGISNDDWGKAMDWARASERGSGWLAEPDHAARYGTSVRVAGHRDVFVEAIKDGAVGMYDRNVALRTRDRVAALGSFTALTPDRARALAREYDLDYLVTEQILDLPVAFESGKIRVYRIGRM